MSSGSVVPELHMEQRQPSHHNCMYRKGVPVSKTEGLPRSQKVLNRQKLQLLHPLGPCLSEVLYLQALGHTCFIMSDLSHPHQWAFNDVRHCTGNAQICQSPPERLPGAGLLHLHRPIIILANTH